MAGGGAVALLLRAAALGGFTAAAWLLSGSAASATPGVTEEPPAVEITVEAPAVLAPVASAVPGATPEPSATPDAGATPDTETQSEAPEPLQDPVDAPQVLATPLGTPSLADDPAGWATAFTASLAEHHEPIKHVPAPEIIPPRDPEAPADEDDQDHGPVLDFTGGNQGNHRSGTVSNRAPPEVLKAKAQARAARLAAKAAVELPPPPLPAPAPVTAEKVVPQLPAALVLTTPQTDPVGQPDLTWTEPGQDAPVPAPQPAPVTATASASSSHTDNSGGARGAPAALTSRNELFPPATWSVGERRDARSPGSLPGLPSTSPD